MRFIQHLNESSPQLEIPSNIFNDEIHKNCKQYLKLIKGLDPMARGMYSYYEFGIKDVRKDRHPYGMSNKTANEFNKWLASQGHTRRDISVLCTSNTKSAELFGRINWIFPKDRIKSYTWVDTDDVNTYGANGWQPNTISAGLIQSEGGELSTYSQLAIDELSKPFPDFFHTNYLFRKAHAKGYEMWIDCDKYYYVSMSYHKWNKNKQIITTT